MATKLMKCYQKTTGCFAEKEGQCQLLESFTKMDPKLGFPVRHYGTHFHGTCPFYKTAEQAGGTYDELCIKYPIRTEGEERRI